MDPFRRDDCISAMMQALVFAISELTTLSIESVLTDGRYGRAEQDRGSSADIGMFGLPKDYPMVAPAYAKQRSSLAKSLGLGRKPAPVETAPEIPPEPELKAPKRSRAKAAA